MSWTARRLRPALAPAILLAGLLGLWELLAQTGVLADVFGIEDFLVPARARSGRRSGRIARCWPTTPG